MKRIYITAVPLQSNFILNAQPVECVNINLPGDEQMFFPISRLIKATIQPGEQALVISVRQTNDAENKNYENLKKDLDNLGIQYCLKDIATPETQKKDFLVELFCRLIEVLEEDSIIYADSTFGTKTYPLVMFSALNYAVKIKECEVEQIIYQEQRRDKETHKVISTKIYDITSLFLLDQVVNTLGFSDADPEGKASLLKTLMQL